MVLSSKNVISAGNQQERLKGWIVGFVDGEGSFSIGFVKQPDRQESTRIRRGYKTGYQVDHTFAVVQGAKSLSALEKIQDFFGVGKIYLNKRHDNHKEHMYIYSVSRRQDLLEVIIPFFQNYSLQTAKQKDFEKFSVCVSKMSRNEHLTHSGLIEVAEIATTMNRCKPRKHLIRILRDHTPTVNEI